MGWISKLKDEQYHIDFDSGSICKNDKVVAEISSALQIEILRFFADNPEIWLRKDVIIDRCWPDAYVGDSSFYTTLTHIRELHIKVRESIENRRNLGYKYHGHRSEEINGTLDQQTKNNDSRVDAPDIVSRVVNDGPNFDEADEVLSMLANIVHDDEYRNIKNKLGILVKKLIAQGDISHELKDVIDCCRGLQFKDNKHFAIKQLCHCERLTADSSKFGEEIHLSIVLSLIPLQIALMLDDIESIQEELLSCRAKDTKEYLMLQIEKKYKELNEKNKESIQYEKELERLQKEGVLKDSVLSLHMSIRQRDE